MSDVPNPGADVPAAAAGLPSVDGADTSAPVIDLVPSAGQYPATPISTPDTPVTTGAPTLAAETGTVSPGVSPGPGAGTLADGVVAPSLGDGLPLPQASSTASATPVALDGDTGSDLSQSTDSGRHNGMAETAQPHAELSETGGLLHVGSPSAAQAGPTSTGPTSTGPTSTGPTSAGNPSAGNPSSIRPQGDRAVESGTPPSTPVDSPGSPAGPDTPLLERDTPWVQVVAGEATHADQSPDAGPAGLYGRPQSGEVNAETVESAAVVGGWPVELSGDLLEHVRSAMRQIRQQTQPQKNVVVTAEDARHGYAHWRKVRHIYPEWARLSVPENSVRLAVEVAYVEAQKRNGHDRPAIPGLRGGAPGTSRVTGPSASASSGSRAGIGDHGGAGGHAAARGESLVVPVEMRERITQWRPQPGGPGTLRAFLLGLSCPVTVDLVKAWAQGLIWETNEADGYVHTRDSVAELSGGLARSDAVLAWWGEVLPLVVPEEVRQQIVKWRPQPGGPQTLREFLRGLEWDGGQKLPLARDKSGRFACLVTGDLVKAWVKGLRWQTKADGYAHTTDSVVKLSGGLAGSDAVRGAWREVLPPVVPEEVRQQIVGWRPQPGGPQHLREFLRGLEWDGGQKLPLARDKRGRFACLVTGDLVKAWVKGLRWQTNEADGYVHTKDSVAELSGGLLGSITVRDWWGKVLPPVVPEEVRQQIVGWRPQPGEPQTMWKFLLELEWDGGQKLPLGRDMRGLFVCPVTDGLVREWERGLESSGVDTRDHADVGQGGSAAVVEAGAASDTGPDGRAQRKRQASSGSGRDALEPPAKRVRPDSLAAAGEVDSGAALGAEQADSSSGEAPPEHSVEDPGAVDPGLTHFDPVFDPASLVLGLTDLGFDQAWLEGLDLGASAGDDLSSIVGQVPDWLLDSDWGTEDWLGVPDVVAPSIADTAVVSGPSLTNDQRTGFAGADLFETRDENAEGAIESFLDPESIATPKESQSPLEESRWPFGRITAHTHKESASGMSPSREHRTALSDDDIARLNPAGLDYPASADHPFAGEPAGMPTDTWPVLARKTKVASEPAIHLDSVPFLLAREYIKSTFPHLLSVNSANFFWYEHFPGNVNCLKCIEATDKAIDNMVAEAPWAAEPGNTGTAIRNYFHTTAWNRYDSWDYAIRHMKETQLGARAIVYVETAGPIAHVFNVINRPEGVVFLDGQTGKLGKLSPDATQIVLVEYSGRRVSHPGPVHQLPDELRLPAVLTGPPTSESASEPGRHDAGNVIPSELKPAGGNVVSIANPASTEVPPEGMPAAILPDTPPQSTRAAPPDTPLSTTVDAPPPGSPTGPDTLLLERDSPLPVAVARAAVPLANDRGDQVGVSFSAPSPAAVGQEATLAPAPNGSVWRLFGRLGARVGALFSWPSATRGADRVDGHFPSSSLDDVGGKHDPLQSGGPASQASVSRRWQENKSAERKRHASPDSSTLEPPRKRVRVDPVESADGKAGEDGAGRGVRSAGATADESSSGFGARGQDMSGLVQDFVGLGDSDSWVTRAQQAAAKELGLEILNIEADGNCFYRAVLATMPADKWEAPHLRDAKSVQGLRHVLANYLIEHGGRYRDFIIGKDEWTIADEIRKLGSWDNEGGDLALKLAADLLGVNITVIFPDGSRRTFQGVGSHDTTETYHIVFNGMDRRHYMATRRLPETRDVGTAGGQRRDPVAPQPVSGQTGPGEGGVPEVGDFGLGNVDRMDVEGTNADQTGEGPVSPAVRDDGVVLLEVSGRSGGSVGPVGRSVVSVGGLPGLPEDKVSRLSWRGGRASWDSLQLDSSRDRAIDFWKGALVGPAGAVLDDGDRVELEEFAGRLAGVLVERAEQGLEMPDLRLMYHGNKNENEYGRPVAAHQLVEDVVRGVVEARVREKGLERDGVAARLRGLRFTYLSRHLSPWVGPTGPLLEGPPRGVRIAVYATPDGTEEGYYGALELTEFFLRDFPVLSESARLRVTRMVQGLYRRVGGDPGSGEVLDVGVVVVREGVVGEVEKLIREAVGQVRNQFGAAGSPSVDDFLRDSVRIQPYRLPYTYFDAVLFDVVRSEQASLDSGRRTLEPQSEGVRQDPGGPEDDSAGRGDAGAVVLGVGDTGENVAALSERRAESEQAGSAPAPEDEDAVLPKASERPGESARPVPQSGGGRLQKLPDDAVSRLFRKATGQAQDSGWYGPWWDRPIDGWRGGVYGRTRIRLKGGDRAELEVFADRLAGVLVERAERGLEMPDLRLTYLGDEDKHGWVPAHSVAEGAVRRAVRARVRGRGGVAARLRGLRFTYLSRWSNEPGRVEIGVHATPDGIEEGYSEALELTEFFLEKFGVLSESAQQRVSRMVQGFVRRALGAPGSGEVMDVGVVAKWWGKWQPDSVLGLVGEVEKLLRDAVGAMRNQFGTALPPVDVIVRDFFRIRPYFGAHSYAAVLFDVVRSEQASLDSGRRTLEPQSEGVRQDPGGPENDDTAGGGGSGFGGVVSDPGAVPAAGASGRLGGGSPELMDYEPTAPQGGDNVAALSERRAESEQAGSAPAPEDEDAVLPKAFERPGESAQSVGQSVGFVGGLQKLPEEAVSRLFRKAKRQPNSVWNDRPWWDKSIAGWFAQVYSPGAVLDDGGRARLEGFADELADMLVERAERGLEMPDLRLTYHSDKFKYEHGRMPREHGAVETVVRRALRARVRGRGRGGVAARLRGLRFTYLIRPSEDRWRRVEISVHATPDGTEESYYEASELTEFFLEEVDVLSESAQQRVSRMVQGFVSRALGAPGSGEVMDVGVVANPESVRLSNPNRVAAKLVGEAEKLIREAVGAMDNRFGAAGSPSVDAILQDFFRIRPYEGAHPYSAVLFDVVQSEQAGSAPGPEDDDAGLVVLGSGDTAGGGRSGFVGVVSDPGAVPAAGTSGRLRDGSPELMDYEPAAPQAAVLGGSQVGEGRGGAAESQPGGENVAALSARGVDFIVRSEQGGSAPGPEDDGVVLLEVSGRSGGSVGPVGRSVVSVGGLPGLPEDKVSRLSWRGGRASWDSLQLDSSRDRAIDFWKGALVGPAGAVLDDGDRVELEEFAGRLAGVLVERAEQGLEMPDLRLMYHGNKNENEYGRPVAAHQLVEDVVRGVVEARVREKGLERDGVAARLRGLRFTYLSRHLSPWVGPTGPLLEGPPRGVRIAVYATPDGTEEGYYGALELTEFFLRDFPVLSESARLRVTRMVQGLYRRVGGDPGSGEVLDVGVVVVREGVVGEVEKLIREAVGQVRNQFGAAGSPSVDDFLRDSVRIQPYRLPYTYFDAVLFDVVRSEQASLDSGRRTLEPQSEGVRQDPGGPEDDSAGRGDAGAVVLGVGDTGENVAALSERRAESEQAGSAPAPEDANPGTDDAGLVVPGAGDTAGEGSGFDGREQDRSGLTQDLVPLGDGGSWDRQRARATALGLEILDVEANGDCFPQSVLVSVPKEVLERRLGELGFERSVEGLRNALANKFLQTIIDNTAYFGDTGLDAWDVLSIEENIRTPGSWNNVGGDIAPQLASGVLGVNIMVIGPDGRESAQGAEFRKDWLTCYIVYNGTNHYMATRSLHDTHTARGSRAPVVPQPASGQVARGDGYFDGGVPDPIAREMDPFGTGNFGGVVSDPGPLHDGSLELMDYEPTAPQAAVLGGSQVGERRGGAASSSQEPAELPGVRAFAEQLQRHIEADQFDEAVMMLHGLDRDMRTVWAVQDAYQAASSRSLGDDLMNLRPEHAHAVFDALGFVNDNPVSLEQAAWWHEQLKNSTFNHHSSGTVPIRIDYPETGCAARAHFWSLQLQRMGAQPSKIFVVRTNPGRSVASANAVDAWPGLPGTVNWGFHVAPAIVVGTPYGPRNYVLDPALSDAPLPAEDWLALMGIDIADENGVILLSGSPEHVQGALDQHRADHPDQWLEYEPSLGSYPNGKALIIFSDPDVWDWLPVAPGSTSLREADSQIRHERGEEELISFNEEAERRVEEHRRLGENLLSMMDAAHSAGFDVFSFSPADPNALSYDPAELDRFFNAAAPDAVAGGALNIDDVLRSSEGQLQALFSASNIGQVTGPHDVFAENNGGFDGNAFMTDAAFSIDSSRGLPGMPEQEARGFGFDDVVPDPNVGAVNWSGVGGFDGVMPVGRTTAHPQEWSRPDIAPSREHLEPTGWPLVGGSGEQAGAAFPANTPPSFAGGWLPGNAGEAWPLATGGGDRVGAHFPAVSDLETNYFPGAWHVDNDEAVDPRGSA
ncbi:protein-glutamine glutaminase family protein [Saccharopolyspora sp. NPDC003762]